MVLTSLTFQSNGLDERYNQTLQQMLAKFIDKRKDKWDEFLDTCVYAYNTSVHESTHFTPFEVMFGRKAVLPIDIDVSGKDPEEKVKTCSDELSTAAFTALGDRRRKLLEQVKGNIIRAQEKQKQDYDCRRANPKAYYVGYKVLKKDFLQKKRAGGKIEAKYLGPYAITGYLGRGLYSLQLIADPTQTIARVNGAHLKPYHTPPSSRETFGDETLLSPVQADQNLTQLLNGSAFTESPQVG